MKSRFSEEQISSIWKQQENGVPTAQVCREHGISEATFYKWKAKFGGMNVAKPNDCANSKTRTPSSNVWWLT